MAQEAVVVVDRVTNIADALRLPVRPDALARALVDPRREEQRRDHGREPEERRRPREE